jgi:hypothetical protein
VADFTSVAKSRPKLFKNDFRCYL